MTSIIELKNIDKIFGSFHAVKNLNLKIERGTAMALLGPNGAGKSTIIQLMLGLRAPTNGSIEYFGKDGLDKHRQRIGATPQEADFPEQLTPREIIQFARNHYNSPQSMDELIKNFQLETLIDRRSKGFSGGEKRRIALALAFAGNPQLVFLDEPTNGLDVAAQKQFQKFAKSYVAAGNTLILTSHNWAEIESIANHIVMIDQGEKVLESAVADLRQTMNHHEISFKNDAPLPKGFEHYNFHENRYHYKTNQSDLEVKKLCKSGIEFQDLSITPMDLQHTIEAIRAQQLSRQIPQNQKAA